jgi:glycosyltransferase involved in cell wall biosynthesis
MPKVSVVMSVYNGEKYLKESIDSILHQTFTDFEFIIINDGSTDETGKILSNYNDSRIKIIEQENLGLTKSLNKGIKLSKGEYIARMDADDISLPERFEKQIKFLDANPEFAAVGCWYYLIDEDGVIIKECKPSIKPYKIKKAFIYSSPIIHPSAMIRRKVLEEVNFYDEKFKYAQDRDLWFRILKSYKLGIIPEFLFKFRYHSSSVSLMEEIEQKKYYIKALEKAIQNGVYSRWYYIYILYTLLSVHLPPPIKNLKNKFSNLIGLRFDKR